MNELRDQLWDFVYGLLDEAAAAQLRERITSDRQVAREYARVKLQSELLAQAARANPSERDVPALGERPSPAALDRAWSPARRIAFTGSLALSLGLLLFAGGVYWSNPTLHGPKVAQLLEEFQADAPRLLVVGPDELQRNADNTFDVTLQTLGGEALVAPVEASLEDSSGNMLWRESAPTNADGKRQVQLPAEKVQGDALLLKIKVDNQPETDEKDGTHGAELKTWLSVNQQAEDSVVVMNRVSDGEQAFFRQAKLYSERPVELSKAIDEVTATRGVARSDTKQSGSSPRDADDVSTADARRVRWGLDRSGQDRYYSPPSADDVKLRSESKEDELKKDFATFASDPAPKSQSEPALSQTTRPTAPPTPAATYDAPAPVQSAPQQPAPAKSALAGTSAETRTENLPLASPATAPASASLPGLEQAETFADEEKLQRNKSLERRKQMVVESITAGDNVIASRLVDGITTEAQLYERIDQAKSEGLIPSNFNGRVQVMWFDAAVAPPQKLAESSVDFGLPVEPLSCTIAFEQYEYRAGDIAQAEVRITDPSGLGLPAVLNVQVDEVPLDQSEAAEQAASPTLFYTHREAPRAPLVFDNGAEQAQQVNQSISNWQVKQQATRRHSALWLLGGSGFGFCVLLAAGSLKWLPKARYWLPVAALLACSAALGATWLQDAPAPAVLVASVDTLTTHGVQSTPPVRGLARTSTFEQGGRGGFEGEWLKRNDLPELQLAMDDHLSPTGKKSESGEPAAERQSLLAMSDWERLAQEDAPQSYAANGFTTADRPEDFSSPEWDSTRRLFGLAPKAALKDLAEPPGGTPKDYSPASGLGASSPATGRTLYWHPQLEADENGVCRLQFPVPNSRLALRLVVLAHQGQRIGSASKLIPTVVNNSQD